MDLTILFPFMAAFSFGVANVVLKYLGLNISIYRLYMLDFFFISLVGAIFLLFKDGFIIENLSTQVITIYGLMGIIGFIGGISLIEGLKRVNAGITMIICYLFVVYSFFVNIYFFQSQETFSVLKTVFAILYLLSTFAFLIEKDDSGKILFNKSLIFPFITSVCWAFFYSASNFLVKNGMVTDFQNAFYSQFVMFIISIFAFFMFASKTETLKSIILNVKMIFWIFVCGLATYLGGFFVSLGYTYQSGNLVNVILTFNVILTAIIGFFFLKEKLSKVELITMLISFLLLILFTIV